MPNRMTPILDAVRKTGTLDSLQRRELQRIVYDDGKVSLAEADTLFAVNDAIDTAACPDWTWVFIGAVTDLLLRHSVPANHIDSSEAIWLMQRITEDGQICGETELELLLNVLKYAESVPDTLEKFALDAVKADVLKNGFVTAEDVERLRQVLYACGSCGGVGISQMEAEVLFDIADAVEGATNDDSFKDLFVGAVANHLMMGEAPARVCTEEALRREYWLHERGDITSGWRRVAKRPFEGFKLVFGKPEKATPGWLHATALADAERITRGEARWLIDRMQRDGKISVLEQALMAFLAEESPAICESLRAVIYKAA